MIDAAKPHVRDGFLFPGIRKGVISDATMARLMERRGMDARPHGFRSSLRDWLAEATDAPHEVAETMLGHVTGGAVVNAYRHTDFLEQRQALLGRWAKPVTGQSGQVVKMTGAIWQKIVKTGTGIAQNRIITYGAGNSFPNPHSDIAEAAREMKATGGYWEYWLIYKINYAERLRSISWPALFATS